MRSVYPKRDFFLRQKKSTKPNLSVLLLIHLQLINIITGPDIILKFFGFRYDDVAEIGLGWFTFSVNFLFILLGVFVLLNNKAKSLKLILEVKKIGFFLVLILLSSFLVLENLFEQSLNLIFLTIGYSIKICSLIILFDKYNIEFSSILLKVLKILMIVMLVYLVIFFGNGFSTTLIGRYQSVFNQPNTLGQFSSLAIAILFSDRLYISRKNKKFNNYSFFFFLLTAIAFVIISQSFTNFLLIILIVLMYFFYVLKNKMLHVLLLVSIALFSFFFFTNSKDLSFLSFSDVNVTSSNFNRDLTLTGRTQIWRDVLDKVQFDDKTLCGYGIGGFWGKTGAPSSKIDNALFAEIGQSHNGMIDLYTQYGLVGISLFVYILFTILKKLSKLKSNSAQIIFLNFFFVLFLFNNLVESSYLQPKNFLNIIFILNTIYILNPKYLLEFRQARLNAINLSQS